MKINGLGGILVRSFTQITTLRKATFRGSDGRTKTRTRSAAFPRFVSSLVLDFQSATCAVDLVDVLGAGEAWSIELEANDINPWGSELSAIGGVFVARLVGEIGIQHISGAQVQLSITLALDTANLAAVGLVGVTDAAFYSLPIGWGFTDSPAANTETHETYTGLFTQTTQNLSAETARVQSTATAAEFLQFRKWFYYIQKFEKFKNKFAGNIMVGAENIQITEMTASPTYGGTLYTIQMTIEKAT